MRLKRLLMKVHAWLALIVGVQVLLWMASGLVMTAMPMSWVRGEHLIAAADPVPLERYGFLTPVADVLAVFPEASEIALRTLVDRPVYEVTAPGGKELVDARSGAPLSPIDEALARRIAAAAVAIAEPVAEAELLTGEPPIDYRGAMPVWRIAFADPESTVLYVAPGTGRVLARRTAQWRVFDWFWMLHIMDYETREEINHPLIWAFSAGGLALALSGAWLLWYSFVPRRLRR